MTEFLNIAKFTSSGELILDLSKADEGVMKAKMNERIAGMIRTEFPLELE